MAAIFITIKALAPDCRSKGATVLGMAMQLLITPRTHLFFGLIPLSDTVIVIIKHLKSSDSQGCAGTRLRYLKGSLTVLIPYLACIINTSTVTGTVPILWPQAGVVQSVRLVVRTSQKNYRPISILPVVFKVFEKVVASQLTKHLEYNNLPRKSQHGFRRNLSTETALMSVAKESCDKTGKQKFSLITL